jgi:hypothetical protein
VQARWHCDPAAAGSSRLQVRCGNETHVGVTGGDPLGNLRDVFGENEGAPWTPAETRGRIT